MRKAAAVNRANELVNLYVQHQNIAEGPGAMMAKTLTELHAELVKYFVNVDDKDAQ